MCFGGFQEVSWNFQEALKEFQEIFTGVSRRSMWHRGYSRGFERGFWSFEEFSWVL